DRDLEEALLGALKENPCPVVITCRTVSYERHRRLLSDWPIFLLGELDPGQQEAFARHYPAEHPKHYDAEALLSELRRLAPMQALAANPLLLSILCFVVDDPDKVALPTTRAALYNRAVEKLLDRPPKFPTEYPDRQRRPPSAKRRAILQRVALDLLAHGRASGSLVASEEEVLEALQRAAEAEGYHTDLAPFAASLLAD
ncbi:MAG: hypothetical protein H5T70_12480, partial [Chloroflexi bacterium]|nr:hypothetical protein [Chloroflexota bacterium]